VRSSVSNTVEVVVVVSVVSAVLVSGTTEVVFRVCSCVETTVSLIVTNEETNAVAVMVVDIVLVFVAPLAVLVAVDIVVEVLSRSATFIKHERLIIHRTRNNNLAKKG
jgi:hypothetical protein